MAVQAQEKGLALIIEYDGLLPATIKTDPMRLRQILLNLVGNAIKFTEQGEVRLTIRLLAANAAGADARLQFVVTDTGVGMSATQFAIIFEAFQQADASTRRRFGGTGLGLTISRQLATLLGGTISVSSKENAGSTFTLTLTLDDPDDLTLISPPPLRALMPDPKPLPRLDGCRVLVVDDRSDIRLLVQRLIEEAGGFTWSAADGRAALARVDQAAVDGEPFDVVIMDMQMPVMDGFEATRQLRSRGFGQPIIALTAGAMLGEREKCLEVGCSSYLSKPVEGHRLLEIIAGNCTVEPQPDAVTTGQDNLPKAAEKLRDYRILIVDDSQNTATALAQLLSHHGFSVDTAFDGRSAIQKAADYCPAAVLLDLNLPDISGFEVLATLKSRPELAQTRFIAISGESLSAVAARQAQFDHHLLKPVVVADLIRLLRVDQTP
jgi:two-component system CheB/CheR fusion protein